MCSIANALCLLRGRNRMELMFSPAPPSAPTSGPAKCKARLFLTLPALTATLLSDNVFLKQCVRFLHVSVNHLEGLWVILMGATMVCPWYQYCTGTGTGAVAGNSTRTNTSTPGCTRAGTTSSASASAKAGASTSTSTVLVLLVVLVELVMSLILSHLVVPIARVVRVVLVIVNVIMA
jgi:hypothetical protein